MKKTSRILIMMLTIIMLASSVMPAYAANVSQSENITTNYDISFKAYYNLAATNRIVANPSNTHLQGDSWIEIKALNISDNYYEGFGHVSCATPFDFVFNGEFVCDTVKTVSRGLSDDTTQTYLGVATGCIVDTQEPITLSIHNLPENDYSFVFMTVGIDSEESQCDTFIFGTVFDEMNEMIALQDERNADKEDNISISSAEISIGGEPAAEINAVSDYDAQWQATSYGYVQKGLTDTTLPVIAVSLYTTNKVKCNSEYSAFVKINASTNNTLIYLRAKYYGVIDASIGSGTCLLYAPSNAINNYVHFKDPDPQDDNFNITLNVPSWISKSYGFILEIIPIAFNIWFDTVKATLSKILVQYMKTNVFGSIIIAAISHGPIVLLPQNKTDTPDV